ncbi:MFS transporter [Lawsonibacter sp. OA9]|uniref:MFS transporter n=1 Tax=Oscillospiraceae TaxID=216572 RepID=UPI001F067864|nr:MULTISPECIES: MFS transporter [Oscillospiraceae]MCH1978149.1 MFS transporter [Lawsonibacter sp. OA9]MCH1982069.1 MFS transporter [Ruminococcus sp. OA3]
MKQRLFNGNFTFLILGQVCSLFGNYILKFAMSMYVLETTGSAAVFAGILAVATIPTILLSPLGGILADRANRRNIMVALDLLSGLSVLCAVLLFSEHSGITIIGVLLVVLSVLGAFESPTVQACVPQMQTGDNIIKGNAVVNQVAAVAGLFAPILGSVLYVAFGMRPVMIACILCFFITAFFECFIRLEKIPCDSGGSVLSIIKNDFLVSMRFICREQTKILKLLILSAIISFFVIGTAMVGLPYIVRTVLGLNAEYYGAAESALGFAAIAGSIAAGVLTGKLKSGKLSRVLLLLGGFVVMAGMVFLFPVNAVIKYAVNIIAFCGVQAAVCIFSIFALSMIQQKTPDHLIGKVMAYVSAVTMCAQPLGQTVYGLLFDGFGNAVYVVLIPTGAVICVIGATAAGFLKTLKV